jgi:Family of unknown function (DUF6496)
MPCDGPAHGGTSVAIANGLMGGFQSRSGKERSWRNTEESGKESETRAAQAQERHSEEWALGQKVKSKKQAIAIAMSETRKEGGKAPKKRAKKKAGGRKKTSSKKK